MTLAFTRGMSPETPFLMAAVLSGARRPKHRPGAKDWLKIANRLAAGLPPRAAALPEGGDEALVARLLEREEFRAVVAGARDDLAAAPEAHRRRLVLLARQALERALALATTRRWRCSCSRRRPATATRPRPSPRACSRPRRAALRPPAEQPAEAAPRPLPLGPLAHDDAPRHRPAAPRHPGRGRHPPRRGAGRGRAAPHHRRGRAARAGAQQGAERPIVALRHGLFAYADTGELVETDPAPANDHPKRAQAP